MSGGEGLGIGSSEMLLGKEMFVRPGGGIAGVCRSDEVSLGESFCSFPRTDGVVREDAGGPLVFQPVAKIESKATSRASQCESLCKSLCWSIEGEGAATGSKGTVSEF